MYPPPAPTSPVAPTPSAPTLADALADLSRYPEGSLARSQAQEFINRGIEEDEFRAWIRFVGLETYANACVAKGYYSLNTLQLRTEDEMVTWAFDCGIPSGFHRRLQDKKATMESFREQFRVEREAKEAAAARRKAMVKMETDRRAAEEQGRVNLWNSCNKVSDLGIAAKRGKKGTENWNTRRFKIANGVLRYYKEKWYANGKRGGSVLTSAVVTEPEPSILADRGSCIHLSVTAPRCRTYLISLQGAPNLMRWKEELARHAYFCTEFPGSVGDPTFEFSPAAYPGPKRYAQTPEEYVDHLIRMGA
jgi:hypothetical protein